MRIRAAFVLAGLLASLAGLPTPGAAQETDGSELLERIRGVGDGEVRMRVPVDEGVVVCDDGSVTTRDGHHLYRGSRREGRTCQEGEVELTFRVSGARITALERPRPTSREGGQADLGTVSGPEAARALLGLARTASVDLARRALLPALLARNATVWPELLEIARDRERPEKHRREAVFWVGQEAAERVAGELAGMASDDRETRKVREAAIFALSQRPADEGVPALMELVRTSGDPGIRRKALFWLAQSEDERVLPFFETLLSGSGSP